LIGSVIVYRGRSEAKIVATYLHRKHRHGDDIEVLGAVDSYGNRITLTADEIDSVLIYAAEQLEDERLVDASGGPGF